MDTNPAVQPKVEGQQQFELDDFKYQRFLGQIRDNQNITLGVLGGAAGALAGAVIWALITYAADFQIGWMAVGVGFLVGFAIRYLGQGIDKMFGIAGAVLALLGCIAGNLLTGCFYIADYAEVGVFDVITRLNSEIISEIMSATFSPMDLLFYGIAVYEGYRFAFRKITDEEMRRLRKAV